MKMYRQHDSRSDIAAFSTLGVGQVGVMLGQTLYAIMPFVEAWWTAAAFWLGETIQEDEEILRDGSGGKIVVMKEEGDGGEKEEAKEGAPRTTRQDGVWSEWRRRPRSLFQGDCGWRGQDL
jgi:hypothetical protein